MKNKIPFINPLLETNLAINAVIDAGKAVMKIYGQEFETKIKANNEPLTEADIESNKIIHKIISNSDHPILSEDTEDDKKRLEQDTVWIVDPLDGTSDFINRTDEFTIMIGLVRKQIPVLGVIFCPTQNTLYVAQQNQGAYQLLGERWSKISTNTIGTMVMEGLKELDPVAYVRFASVYRNFREEKDFVQFVDRLDVYKNR